MNVGPLAALGTLFSWTIATFVVAKLSRLEDPHILNKSILFFSIFLLGILVCVLDGLLPWELFIAPSSSNWLWLSISGIIGKSVGDYWSYRSFRILGVRRRTMITTLGPGFTWLFGLIILNEKMNLLGLTAMLVTIVSLVFLINNNAEKEEVKKESFGFPLPGLFFGIGSAAITGLAFILAKKTIVESGSVISAFHGTWIRIITAFVALMIFDIIRNKNTGFVKQFVLDKKKAMLLFLVVLFGAVLGLSFSLIAITRMNAAAAYTIFSLMPVAVIILSLFVYKKKVSMQSWLYSLLAVAGVIVLIWRDNLIKIF